ncbi:SGNH/GDSL hydrolase family protein [Mangrovimonas xylaniphaga]|uniref:G-D-S-L family lipolytic protein n=1 Tax=Mangrovimonas xylaniphaga TaxID=1645915 RepID=UPI0006B46D27|nr:G-D-S-L family lipolytic protein [Mangrovimonas xylaniphaga]
MNTKYIWLLAISLGFMACDSDDTIAPSTEPLPELTAGEADFSNYVSLGNSLTSGYTDGALFIASQENSYPNILASQFSLADGGTFTQPLMNDNYGGLALAGNRIASPRLVFGGAGPVPLESVIGTVTVTTDIATNNPTGPFNNMGVPGAKSFHLLAPGYGNIANLSAGLANPYFVRMTGATPDASVIEMAMAQNPSFFTMWIGNNDVLGYALSGADGSSPITDQPTFDYAISTLVTTLTSGGAKGVVANIPDITTIPHFTTVPYNPLDPSNPDFGPQIPTLNAIFGALNQVYVAIGAPERAIVFSETEASAVVIKDESLEDISSTITGALMASPTFPAFIGQFGLPEEAAPLVAALLGQTYGQTRQANENDLFVLTSSTVIGTVNSSYAGALMAQGLPQALAGQFSVEGITLPLEDKWVLIPTEQTEIATATNSFNATIQAAASAAGLAMVDANAMLYQLANGGLTDGDFTLSANLVTGGAMSLDGVHLTSRGYAAIANAFLKAIDQTYGSNFEASGNLVDIGNFPTNYAPTLQ